MSRDYPPGGGRRRLLALEVEQSTMPLRSPVTHCLFLLCDSRRRRSFVHDISTDDGAIKHQTAGRRTVRRQQLRPGTSRGIIAMRIIGASVDTRGANRSTDQHQAVGLCAAASASQPVVGRNQRQSAGNGQEVRSMDRELCRAVRLYRGQGCGVCVQFEYHHLRCVWCRITKRQIRLSVERQLRRDCVDGFAAERQRQVHIPDIVRRYTSLQRKETDLSLPRKFNACGSRSCIADNSNSKSTPH